MNFVIFFVLFAIYFPIWGKIFLIQRLETVSVVILSFVVLIKLAQNKTKKFDGRTKKIILFGVYCIIIILAKGILDGEFVSCFIQIQGLLAGTLVALLLVIYDYLDNIESFLKRIKPYITFFLLMQIIISIFESITGKRLDVSYQSDYQLTYNRDILNYFGYSIDNIFGIKTTFAGFLGQHNFFGSMLVFYNLFYIRQYLSTRKKNDLFMLGVVFFGIIANTTRVGILAILVSDFLLFIYIINNKKLKIILSLVPLYLILSSLGELVFKWNTYFEKSDTLTFRFQIWDMIMAQLSNFNNIFILLFGPDINTTMQLSSSIWAAKFGSFENQYFRTFLYWGGIGIFLFVYIFIYAPLRNKNTARNEDKLLGVLLAFNIFLTSLTLDCFDNFSSYVLAVIIYLSIRKVSTKDKSTIEADEPEMQIA